MTDKERLEEIKNRTKYVTYREMGTDSVVRVEIVIEESDFKWLINRVEELVRGHNTHGSNQDKSGY